MENNKLHILVVDDDDRIRDLLKDYLTDNNYIVSTAENAEQAKNKLEFLKFDIIILDVMMPGKNGYELTKDVKKKMKVPIILLTAKGEVENRIKGLELGADDYIGKPFEPKELLLRINNIIKKTNKIDLHTKHLIGSAKVDLNKMIITIKDKNKKINNSEKKVLIEMLSNPGKTFSREEIGKISGISQERSIDVMITRLRQKLETNPKNPKYLQTIRGSGYVLWINKLKKIILPKRLFYRALIIVAAPTILLQLIITIVFYDSIWIKANKNNTRSLVAQLKTIEEIYKNDKKNLDFFTDSYKNNFNFEIGINQDVFPEISGERKFSPMDRSLRRELKSTFGNNNYWFNTSKFQNAVEIKIKSDNDVLEFLVPKEMVSASSVRLFVLWTTLPSIVLIVIALIFLKNQTRPLVKLAKAAERFGKGDYVNDFRPSGAQEIRKAAYEFDRMAKRINRHLNQRSEMLSGISHDLRTPLTRLKLQLAMISQKDLSAKMSKDIDEMERMLNDYLQFAKTQSQENTVEININSLLKEINNNLNNRINISFIDDIYLKGRPMALKRSFENIINNGLIYGKNVFIKVQKSSNRALILFEDDGPGIPEDQYKNVFKPFFRLDKSRSLNQSGIGLGLAIVEDVINSHGGSIQLGKSKLKGLQIKIFLPL